MEKSSCELLLYLPQISEVEDLRSTNIANCVINNFLCQTAVMLNILTIHAMRKTSSLPKSLKTLLPSLRHSSKTTYFIQLQFHLVLQTVYQTKIPLETTQKFNFLKHL